MYVFSAIAKNFRRLFLCNFGGMAALTAVGAPLVLGTAGIAVDYATFNGKRTELQSAADAAAVSAARELSLAKTSAKAIEEVARSYVKAELEESADVSTAVEINDKEGSVTVTLSETWKPNFAHFFGAGITPISVRAKAELVGQSNLCVIALSNSGIGAISMTKDSTMLARGCEVHSNSTNRLGFYVGDSSEIDAAVVCSAGGVFYTGNRGSTKVLTDCPKVADPLAGRATPKTSGCDHLAYVILTGTDKLRPGVYCGGIAIAGNAKVTFEPGTYVIKDGLFVVSDKANVKGKDVAFYLSGALSLMQFLGDATIDLSGAEKGDLTGILFYEDPNVLPLRIHNIRATNAHTLTGTIYLPKGTLLVDPAAAVAQKSAYTAIIAQRLVVENGPNLVLNTNYDATKVPVPRGIRAAADIVLAE